jgi:hypothetical protein
LDSVKEQSADPSHIDQNPRDQVKDNTPEKASVSKDEKILDQKKLQDWQKEEYKKIFSDLENKNQKY